MAETKLKAAPKSPTTPPTKPAPTYTHTTTALIPARDSSAGLPGHWVDRAGRLVRKFRWEDSADQFAPFLEEAEEAYPAMVEEVSATAGQCGPISRRMLQGSAMISATGFFLTSRVHRHADPTSREALTLAKTGAQFLESSSRMALSALEQAVRIARSAPASEADPLAAYREAAGRTVVEAKEPPEDV